MRKEAPLLHNGIYCEHKPPNSGTYPSCVYKSDSVVSPLWTVHVASIHLYSPLIWWHTETKRSKWRNVVKRQWFEAQIIRLPYVNHWSTQNNHFSGNTSTRWLFVDHVPRVNVILEILAFKERGKGENKHTCGITVRSYGWWFHCTIAPNVSLKIKVNKFYFTNVKKQSSRSNKPLNLGSLIKFELEIHVGFAEWGNRWSQWPNLQPT